MYIASLKSPQHPEGIMIIIIMLFVMYQDEMNMIGTVPDAAVLI